MSSDQITYVLVAFIVTGVAILLLLAGALLARRGRTESRASGAAGAAPAPASAPAVAHPVPAAAPVPLVAAPAVATAPSGVPAPATVAEVEGGSEMPVPAPASASIAPTATTEAAPAPAGAAPEEPAVTSADRAAAAQRLHDPREEEIIAGFLSASPRRREAAAFEGPRPPSAVGPAPSEEAPPMAATSAPSAIPAPSATPADPYVDEITGLASRVAWDRALHEESARYVRYRRPVSVVIADLEGLARFEREFGEAAARRIMGAVGDALRRNARRTDHVAHTGAGRYLVLLPETDEIQAINYVERIRGECDRWLEAGAVALRISLGWASPSAVGELDTALRTAEERMFAERRRATRTGANGPDGAR